MDEVFEHEASIGRAEPVADACLGLYRPRRSGFFLRRRCVKVAEKGLKLRVTARDKNWVRVSEPATSANGWIYSRFLKPTERPTQ